MGRRGAIDCLEDHPNLAEILGVLSQLAHVNDSDIPRLAQAWTNDIQIADARDKALMPDGPLVMEVLAAFEAVTSLFADDLAGEAAYVTVDPAITTTALKAVRDAIAAAYAKPVLSRTEHATLMKPWRTVFAEGTVDEPDLGPQSEEVKALLSWLPRLATRCHDSENQAVYEQLVDQTFIDEQGRAGAADSAFQVAVMTSRRRVWALVRRSGAEGLARPCGSCGRSAVSSALDDRESSRVLALCLDAACALLVADAMPDELIDVLTNPVRALIPSQRKPL
ncbi:MAG: hypothetical protein JWO12_1267 [Frankiales bacterium]|nr:hypothetical protein [Frankiales bacterium]